MPPSGLSYTWNGSGGADTRPPLRPPLPSVSLLRTPRPGGWLRELLREDAAPSPRELGHGGRPLAPMTPKGKKEPAKKGGGGGGGGCVKKCCMCYGFCFAAVLGFMMITALVSMAIAWIKQIPCYPSGATWAFGIAWMYAAVYKWRAHSNGLYDFDAEGFGGLSAGCFCLWFCLLLGWCLLGMVLSAAGWCKKSSGGSPGLLLYSTPFTDLLSDDSTGPGAMLPFNNATGNLSANLSTMLLHSVVANAPRLLDTAVEAAARHGGGGHAWSVD